MLSKKEKYRGGDGNRSAQQAELFNIFVSARLLGSLARKTSAPSCVFSRKTRVSKISALCVAGYAIEEGLGDKGKTRGCIVVGEKYKKDVCAEYMYMWRGGGGESETETIVAASSKKTGRIRAAKYKPDTGFADASCFCIGFIPCIFLREESPRYCVIGKSLRNIVVYRI